jgi:hypothetical protein
MAAKKERRAVSAAEGALNLGFTIAPSPHPRKNRAGQRVRNVAPAAVIKPPRCPVRSTLLHTGQIADSCRYTG